MPNTLLDHVAKQAGLEIYLYPSDPHNLPLPHLDKRLVEAFETCEFGLIENLLAKYAHGNQRFLLTPQLTQEIIKAQKESFLPWILRKSRYEVVFEPKYSAEEKELLLQAICASKDTNFSEEFIEKITLIELKKDMEEEFSGKESVSLLWAAVFLKRPDLVQLLLKAPKPADAFTPITLKSLRSNKMGPFFWDLINDGKYCSEELVEILEIFLEAGVSSEDIFSSDEDDQTWLTFLAVETKNYPLLNLIMKQGFDINCYIDTADYPFSYFHPEPIVINKHFPTGILSPLSIAIFNKDVQMAEFLIQQGANYHYLTDSEKEKFFSLLDDED